MNQYKWNITVYFKSGLKLSGAYEGIENNSADVYKKLIKKTDEEFGSITDGFKAQIAYRFSEVAAITVNL